MRNGTQQNIEFVWLTEVSVDALVDMMNDPDVRRHLPLAQGEFTVSDAKRFVASKEQI